MKQNKALFVTHETWIDSTVTGGVQLCSREFLAILKECDFDIETYFVPYTRRLVDRLLLKLRLSVYNFFDIDLITNGIIEHISTNGIGWVFLNMAGLLRLSKPIKKRFGDRVKIYLLSHGNDSGDFLHLTTKPIDNPGFLRKNLNVFRLGYLIHTESYYRNFYLDGVLTVSETEKQIENWFGAKKSIFIPRLIETISADVVPVPGRLGFVGRLDHPPNYQGITLLLDELAKVISVGVKVRIVGAPNDWGLKIEARHPFVEYLGELGDEALVSEAQSWMLFLNPVFWYSTGVTTKMGWALRLGLPVASTKAGLRGYSWRQGALLTADTPAELASAIAGYLGDPSGFEKLAQQVELIRSTVLSKEDVSAELKSLLQ